MILDCAIEDERWNGVDLEGHAQAALDAALAHMGLEDEDWEISLLGCDDARISTLNAEFRGKPLPTNVLSWPAQELAPETEGGRPAPPEVDFMGDAALGDIAIAYETCAAEAEAGGLPFAHHLRHLLVHATLHLLGYDHIRDGDATVMETLEAEILGKMGIADPYTLHDGS